MFQYIKNNNMPFLNYKKDLLATAAVLAVDAGFAVPAVWTQFHRSDFLTALLGDVVAGQLNMVLPDVCRVIIFCSAILAMFAIFGMNTDDYGKMGVPDRRMVCDMYGRHTVGTMVVMILLKSFLFIQCIQNQWNAMFLWEFVLIVMQEVVLLFIVLSPSMMPVVIHFITVQEIWQQEKWESLDREQKEKTKDSRQFYVRWAIASNESLRDKQKLLISLLQAPSKSGGRIRRMKKRMGEQKWQQWLLSYQNYVVSETIIGAQMSGQDERIYIQIMENILA